MAEEKSAVRRRYRTFPLSEMETLSYVSQGLTDDQIAAIADVSRWRVVEQMRKLRKRHNVDSRVQLAAVYTTMTRGGNAASKA